MLRFIPVIGLAVGGAFALGIGIGLVCREPLRRAAKSSMKSAWQASQQFREKVREEFEDSQAEAEASLNPKATSGIH